MRAFEVVLNQIEEALLAGRYPVVAALPPERELASQLGRQA